MALSRGSTSSIKIVNGVYHATSVEHLQTLVLQAIEKNTTLRVSGAEHSEQSAIYSEKKDQIKIKLFSEEKQNELRKVTFLEKKENSALVEVGAGCYIGINPGDETSNEKNSLVYQLNQAGYALPQLGGISHQSISGFLATSSSGGSTESLHKIIVGIKFVDGTGKVRELKKGDPDFPAVVSSAGLLGPVISYTLEVPEQYYVKGQEKDVEFLQSSLAPDEKKEFSKLKKALNENEFAHFLWYPLPGRVCEYKANKIPYGSEELKPYKHVLSSRIMSRAAEGILKATDEKLKSDNPEDIQAVGLMQDIFVPIHGPLSGQEFCDEWYKTSTDDQVVGLDSFMSMTFCELWFPQDQLNIVMNRLIDLFKTNPKAAGNLPLEIYASPNSPFWMSSSYGADAVRVDIYWWKKNTRNMDEFFGYYLETLHDIPGLKFHLGKYLPKPQFKYGKYESKAEDVVKNIEHLPDFLKVREKYDPKQVFVTDYWRNYFKIPILEKEAKLDDGSKKIEGQGEGLTKIASAPEKPVTRTWGDSAYDIAQYAASYLSFLNFSGAASSKQAQEVEKVSVPQKAPGK